MSSPNVRAKNRLVTGIQGNGHQRDLSPVGDISQNEGIELKDIHQLKNRKSTPIPNKHFDTEIAVESDDDDIDSDIEETQFQENDKSLQPTRQITVFSMDGSDNDKTPRSSRKSRSRDAWLDQPSKSRAAASSAAFSTSLDLSMSDNSSSPCGIGSIFDEDEELDYFCVDHMKLCSNKSIRDEHNTCENLVPAFEWAEAQKMETDRRQVESRLKRFNTFTGIMIDERKDYKKKLELSKEEATEDFLDMMEELVSHFLVKQREFLASFDDLHERTLQTINDQIRRCSKVQAETSAALKELSELLPGSEEHQRLKRRLQDKCPVYEEILRRDFKAAVRRDYEFVPNKETQATLHDLNSLGGMRMRLTPSKLPGFLSESVETDFLKRKVSDVSRNEGVSEKDENSCCFSGCAYLTGGQMVLADWNNACVKLFNNKGVLINRLSLPNNPWDVKKVDDSKLVVSVPGEKKLFILGYSKTELNMITSIYTDCECWGVTPVEDTFVVICDPWSKEPCLKVFGFNGKLISFYQKDSRGKMLFRYPEHVDTDPHQTTLYVSDSRSHMVTAISLAGRIIFRYTHERLEHPAGIATDNQGNVYVCGKDSQNVHQISKDGQFVRTIFDRIDVECPRAICFEPNGDNFIVTDVATNSCDDFITAKLA